MATMNEICEALRRRDEANPEAARLRKQVADLAIRESRLLALRHDGWLTQAQAAELIGVHRGTVNRAVRADKIWTNGCTGNRCRIHPGSLCEHFFQRDEKQLQRLNN